MNAQIKTSVTNPTLAEIAESIIHLKNIEASAREERIRMEQLIIEKVGAKEEGTTTAEDGNFKVKTVGKLTRSIDTNAVQADWDNLDPAIQKCIKWKADLDTKNLRSLESMRDDLVPVIAKYMTTKPAKPSVTVEQVEA